MRSDDMNNHPIKVTTPPDKRPWFLGLRTWWHEYFGSMPDAIPAAFQGRPLRLDDRAATLRWQAHNAAQPVECQCGRPGTVRITDPRGGYVGSVAPYWWRCDEHADLPINTQFVDGRRATREECSFTITSISTGVVSDCGCGTHVGETRR